MVYILVMRDTKFWLVGGFETQEAATAFGRKHYAPGGPDDPRWQTIELAQQYNGIGAMCYSPERAAVLTDEQALPNFRV